MCKYQERWWFGAEEEEDDMSTFANIMATYNNEETTEGTTFVPNGTGTTTTTTTTTTPTAPAQRTELKTSEELKVNESLKNSCYWLVMQGDGNLVVYGKNGTKPLWASDTGGKGGNRVVMQGDGNLVIYGPSGAVWATDTTGRGGDRLVMQGDGNLVMYGPSGAIWASRSNIHADAGC